MRGVIDDSKLENIAVAIRERTGTETKYTPEEMPGGVSEVYDKGKSDEWNSFWDAFQANGTRNAYDVAFGSYSQTAYNGWNDRNFRPKYNIKGTTFERAFKACRVTDLKSRLEQCGVILDTSASTSFMQAFSYATFTHIPEIDASKATSIVAIFCDSSKIHTIDKLKLPTINNLAFTESFRNCSNLKNIIFEGTIARTISFSASPLTVESMKSIILSLANHAGTTSEYTYTLSLKSDCWTLLEAEGTTSPSGTLWREYVGELGWLTA